ncbi:uncharacterized protein METZ01_LOCUS106576 [marine metagenome]|uniref:Uncharacterized protein n=1 Tax=marine metagenome TaxID=408172 RepID=A0A381WMS8_9ZZZZ
MDPWKKPLPEEQKNQPGLKQAIPRHVLGHT